MATYITGYRVSSGSQNKMIALLLHTNEKCVTQLFRHRMSLLYAFSGSGHCWKKNISENTRASDLYCSGNLFSPPSPLSLPIPVCRVGLWTENYEVCVTVVVQVPSSTPQLLPTSTEGLQCASPSLHPFVPRSALQICLHGPQFQTVLQFLASPFFLPLFPWRQ